MIQPEARKAIQRIKDADTISVKINGGTNAELQLDFTSRRANIRKLNHDIALAIQDFYNRLQLTTL